MAELRSFMAALAEAAMPSLPVGAATQWPGLCDVHALLGLA